MKQVIRGVMTAALVVWMWSPAAVEGAEWRPGPRVSAAAAESGVKFSLMSVSATSSVEFGEEGGPALRGEGQLRVVGRFTRVEGDGVERAVFPWRMVIESAMDEEERELIDPGRADRGDQVLTRMELGEHFQQVLVHGRPGHEVVQDFVRGLGARPDRVDRVRGRAEAVVGGRVVRRAVELKAMAEGVEVAPGVVLLITEVARSARRCVVDFEVRTRRLRDAEAGRAGLEPVFVGLALKDARGELLALLRSGQEVEARDEYLFLAREQSVSKEILDRAAGAEAWVVEEIRPVRLEFEVAGLASGLASGLAPGGASGPASGSASGSASGN